jgi:uncharacterized membrane protein
VSDFHLRAVLAGLAAIGAAIAAYVLVARWTHTTLACSTGGCETVQASDYATLAGVPVALLGLAAYIVLAGSALLSGHAARLATAVLALGGVLFSGYLLVVQLAVIHAVCQWCVANDVVATLVATIALLRLRGGPECVVGRNHVPSGRGWRDAPQRRV